LFNGSQQPDPAHGGVVAQQMVVVPVVVPHGWQWPPEHVSPLPQTLPPAMHLLVVESQHAPA
jgi:hypothetical protein